MKMLTKYLAILFTVLLAMQFNCKDSGTDPAISNWVPMGLEGKLVSNLVIIGDYIYACAGRDGLYRINKKAANALWTYLGLADTSVERTIESGVTDIISVEGVLLASYVAGYQHKKSGVYRSADNGQTWMPSDSGMITIAEYPTPSQIIRLRQSPGKPSRILATTTVDLLYLSEDGGLYWRKIFGTPGASVINFAVCFVNTDPNQIWIGGETGFFAPYLLYTGNGGESWSDRIWFPPNIGPYTYDNAVYDITVDPNNDNILYFGMLGAIVKTTDKAQTFQRILGWEDGIYPNWRLAINPSDSNEIFATGYYLYRTTDGGQKWQKIMPPFFVIYALAVDWTHQILYVSVSSPENGIYKFNF